MWVLGTVEKEQMYCIMPGIQIFLTTGWDSYIPKGGEIEYEMNWNLLNANKLN